LWQGARAAIALLCRDELKTLADSQIDKNRLKKR
ncbi:MAG: hypothetical protein RLZZ490_695, partial [Cyanobacteriota bacterium]